MEQPHKLSDTSGFLIQPAAVYSDAPAVNAPPMHGGPALGPREAAGSEKKLAVRIAHTVKRRTAGSVQNLRVEVRRDGVFLDGQCETFYSKQLAQQAAMDLADEKPLTNRIEVLQERGLSTPAAAT